MSPIQPANESAADPNVAMRAINEACRKRGGRYAQYSCKAVSWDDVSRGTAGGGLSCWGSNITDTYLKAKSGTALYTVRPDNWNEKLGKVSASEVALVAGHTLPDGGPLRPVTLRDFLANIGAHGAYAGLDASADLFDAALDAEVSIRFQTTFLPISGGDARGTLEFATEAYNYNTMSDDDPRNLVLLCTTQGVAVQQDGAGAKRLFHHAVDGDGDIHRYWLEAERSDHRVGGAQLETAAEQVDAAARGKATAAVIGTRAMGTRFNVLMTVQVPLQQRPQARHQGFGGVLPASALGCAEGVLYSLGGMDDGAAWCEEMEDDGDCEDEESACFAAAAPMSCTFSLARKGFEARTGVSNAARVSRGTEHDVWPGLSATTPKRHPGEHPTVTVVMYNTVAGGVPSEEDVAAAIDDLEALYAACGASGHLAQKAFDFMKKPLTTADADKIVAKITAQPYTPPPAAVEDPFAFPTDQQGAGA